MFEQAVLVGDLFLFRRNLRLDRSDLFPRLIHADLCDGDMLARDPAGSLRFLHQRLRLPELDQRLLVARHVIEEIRLRGFRRRRKQVGRLFQWLVTQHRDHVVAVTIDVQPLADLVQCQPGPGEL